MLIRLFIGLVCVFAVAGCETIKIRSVSDEEPESEVASWETPAEEPGAAAIEPAPEPAAAASEPVRPVAEPRRTASEKELEAIRQQNKDLKDQVSDLTEKVRAMKKAEEEPATAVTDPERGAAGRGTDDAARLSDALRRAGVSDLEVAISARGEVYVVLPGSLSFGAGRADLMKAAKDRLTRLSGVLREIHPETRLRMDGHTDSDPIRKSKWASNHQLSEARAGAVADYFTGALGWSATRVTTQGFGAERPIASNSTRDGKARNRRVEIVLVR